MCGRVNVTDNEAVRFLMDELGISIYPTTRLNVSPLSHIQFVHQNQEGRHLVDGIWSLLIEPNPNTGNYRQIKSATGAPLSTFNAASRNIKTSRLWKPLLKNRRSIVPVSGFHEWAIFEGKKTCFNIAPADGSAIAMGGLYDFRKVGDQVLPVTATITLAPHPKFEFIHKKSIPLMLLPGDFDMWLDPDFSDVEAFTDLFESRIRFDWTATPVDSAATLKPIGEPFLIASDKE